jgi:outer membrane protein OmpA-like peptidoglycan-associated protein
MLRLLRFLAVILLSLGMTACARLPWEPPPENGPPESGQAEQPVAKPAETDDAGVEPAPDPVEEAPRSGGIAVQAIGIGEASLAERRRVMIEGGRAIEPDALGYFMDVHEARLLQSLGDSIRMRRDGGTFRLLVTGRASFNTGSSRVRDFLIKELRSLAEVLTEFENTLVVVHAHTDSRGDTGFNQSLSERRARRVAELLAEHGVERARLIAVGHGEQDPVADNETASGRAKNRRIEIVVETMVQTAPE